MAFVCFCFAGCRTESLREGGSEGDNKDPKVLAKVGDYAITSEDLEAALKRIPEDKREGIAGRVLDDLIQIRVFSSEARTVGLDNEPEVKEGLVELTDDLLAREFVRKHIDQKVRPSEQEVEDYYGKHKDDFVNPEAVRVERVMVKERDEAEKALEALKAGTSFEELAKDESIGKESKKGALPGWQYRGWMEPALEEVAFGLDQGQVSGVIETKKGYEIIKVLEKREKRHVPFKDVAQRLRARLFSERKRQLGDEYYEKAGVNRNPSQEGVLAVIGEKLITQEALAPKLAKVPNQNKEKIKRRWIDYLIEKRVFSDEAKRIHLEDDPDVSRELDVRTDRLLANAFRKKFVAGDEISEEEVADHYQSNLEDFRSPVKVQFKSILVETRQEAESILKESGEGAAFGDLAARKSKNPRSSHRGGKIGWFAQGEMDPAVEEVAFSLGKKAVSGIIETEKGYEIIKLMDRRGGDIKPLDQVKDAIRMDLILQHFEEKKQHYYDKAGVEILGP
jgi:parvulin-like peptidyl-prolyl isomerase